MNDYEVKADIGVIARKTMLSMLERLECEVSRYYKNLSFEYNR